MKSKIFCPKYFIAEINGIKHKIEIKVNPFSNKVTILIDGSILIKDVIKGMHRLVFYPLKIDSKDVIVKLADDGFYFTKDVYIDGISIKTGYHIDKEKNELQKIAEKGLCEYLALNIISICRMICVITIFFILQMLISLYRDRSIIYIDGIILSVIIYIVSSIIISFGYFIYNWLSAKYKLKRWDTQYRVF